MGRKKGVSQGHKLSDYMKQPAKKKRKPSHWNEFSLEKEETRYDKDVKEMA